MAAIAQTIAIVDKSGKVISTGKQLKNIFDEAKLAYMERRAEVKMERKAKEDHELHKAMRAMTIANESRSEASRPRSPHHGNHSRREGEHRPRLEGRPSSGERHYSGSSRRSNHNSQSSTPRSPHSPSIPTPSRQQSSNYHSPHLEDDTYYNTRQATPPSPSGAARTSQDLVRRHTDMDLTHAPPPYSQLSRSNSTSAIDMDLAYGDFHPTSLAPHGQTGLARQDSKQELNGLVQKCKMLLDEAKCASHSVKAIVAHLQQNPDAMAAVALTLAEISNLATKMAPGALTALKAGAPTVFALLAAPEFLIAVGVSVGITVVMFGGYKIIKKIRARNAEKEETGVDEMMDVEELTRIDHWRRGITYGGAGDDAGEAASVVSGATSVEGEFITPNAARSLGHLPLPREGRSERKKREKREGKERKSELRSQAKSERKHAKANSSSGSSSRQGSLAPSDSGTTRAAMKVKKPSPLRRMFKSGDSRDGRSSVSGSAVRSERVQEI